MSVIYMVAVQSYSFISTYTKYIRINYDHLHIFKKDDDDDDDEHYQTDVNGK